MIRSMINHGKKSKNKSKKRNSTSTIPPRVPITETPDKTRTVSSKLSASISCPPSLSSASILPISVVDQVTTQVHRIAFLQQIGDGSSGRVFVASSFHSVEPVRGIFAVKIFFKEHNLNFFREQYSLMKLHHPTIPSVLFSATLPSSEMMLAMDLGCGGSLFSLILDRGCLNESEAKSILRQVFAAVAHAHSCKIVHRDIKLENLIFKDYSQKTVYLIDWGLSTTFSYSTLLRDDCGSLPYAAPELLKQLPYIGPEVDAWSLGVLTYITLVGELPFSGSTVEAKLEGIMHLPFFPPTLSLQIVSLISSLLRVDTATRMLPTEALNHEWFLQEHSYDSRENANTASSVDLQSPSSRKIGPSKFCYNLGDFLDEPSNSLYR